MPKLPVVNGREMIRALQRAGFVLDSQESSHVTMFSPVTGRHATVPVHAARDMKTGTVRNVLRQAGLTVEEFHELLK